MGWLLALSLVMPTTFLVVWIAILTRVGAGTTAKRALLGMCALAGLVLVASIVLVLTSIESAQQWELFITGMVLAANGVTGLSLSALCLGHNYTMSRTKPRYTASDF